MKKVGMYYLKAVVNAQLAGDCKAKGQAYESYLKVHEQYEQLFGQKEKAAKRANALTA